MKYSKESLVKSVKYADKADVLAVVLQDGNYYTFSEVDELVKLFFNKTTPQTKTVNKKKGKVN